MTKQWKPTGDKWPQMAMVLVSSVSGHVCYVVGGDPPETRVLPTDFLHPMPPAITPEQQAVLDAAKKQEIVGGSTRTNITAADYDAACRNTNIAVRAMLAAQQPPDPMAEVVAAARDLVENALCGNADARRLRAALAALEKEKKS